MSLRINQNIDALNSYRNLSVTQGQMSKSLEKLSSGFRINRAADDAAGLAISEGLRSQVGGLKVAVRNAQDGISVVQTAEGALTEVHSMLQRMNDLAVQYNNGTQNADSQAALAAEFDPAARPRSAGSRTTPSSTATRCSTAPRNDLPGRLRQHRHDRHLGDRRGRPSRPAVDGAATSPTADASDDVQTQITARLDAARRARCHPEPVRAHHQQPQRGDREPVGVGEPDPRHRHGAGDDELHPLADPVARPAPRCSRRPTRPRRASCSCSAADPDVTRLHG